MYEHKKNLHKNKQKSSKKTPPKKTHQLHSSPPQKTYNNKNIQNKTKQLNPNARCNLHFLLYFGPLLFRNLCAVCVDHPLPTLHTVLLLIFYCIKDSLFPKDIQNEDISHRLKLPAAVPAVIAPVTNKNASNQSNSEAEVVTKAGELLLRDCSNSTVAIIYLYGESSAHALLYFKTWKTCCISF